VFSKNFKRFAALHKERQVNAPQTQLPHAKYRYKGNHPGSLSTQFKTKDFFVLDYKPFGVFKFPCQPLELLRVRESDYWKSDDFLDIHFYLGPSICPIPMAVSKSYQIRTRFALFYKFRLSYSRSYV
jgi:hypothetical protein